MIIVSNIFPSIIRRYLFYLTSAGFYRLTPFLPSAIVHLNRVFLPTLFALLGDNDDNDEQERERQSLGVSLDISLQILQKIPKTQQNFPVAKYNLQSY